MFFRWSSKLYVSTKSKSSDLFLKFNKNAPIILVGNHIDSKEQKNVSTEDGNALATLFNIKFFETSAVTAENIDLTFNSIISDALDIAIRQKEKTVTEIEEASDTLVSSLAPLLGFLQIGSSSKVREAIASPESTKLNFSSDLLSSTQAKGFFRSHFDWLGETEEVLII